MNEQSGRRERDSQMPAREARKLLGLLALAAALFMVGITMPMLTISKFVFVKNSFSVLSGVIELFRHGQYVLFAVVAGFSVVLPLLKLHVLYRLLSPTTSAGARTRRYLHLMHEYGRWAMLDVMVVAVLIVTVKLGAIASVEVHIGLYVFGAAVLLIMLITKRVIRLTS